jgi:hypothetical protein
MYVGINTYPIEVGTNKHVQTELVGYSSYNYEHTFFTAGNKGNVGFKIERYIVFIEDVVTKGLFNNHGKYIKTRVGNYIAL